MKLLILMLLLTSISLEINSNDTQSFAYKKIMEAHRKIRCRKIKDSKLRSICFKDIFVVK